MATNPFFQSLVDTGRIRQAGSGPRADFSTQPGFSGSPRPNFELEAALRSGRDLASKTIGDMFSNARGLGTDFIDNITRSFRSDKISNTLTRGGISTLLSGGLGATFPGSILMGGIVSGIGDVIEFDEFREDLAEGAPSPMGGILAETDFWSMDTMNELANLGGLDANISNLMRGRLNPGLVSGSRDKFGNFYGHLIDMGLISHTGVDPNDLSVDISDVKKVFEDLDFFANDPELAAMDRALREGILMKSLDFLPADEFFWEASTPPAGEPGGPEAPSEPTVEDIMRDFDVDLDTAQGVVDRGGFTQGGPGTSFGFSSIDLGGETTEPEDDAFDLGGFFDGDRDDEQADEEEDGPGFGPDDDL